MRIYAVATTILNITTALLQTIGTVVRMGISISVVLVPVSLVPVGDGNDVKVVAYRPRRWLERVLDSDNPEATARALLDQTPGLDPEVAQRPEPVGFLPGGATTKLVFTAPVAMTATLKRGVDDQDRAWIGLPPNEWDLDEGQDAIRLMVLNYWRQALSETTAAFDMLPRYFTTSQVRSIYATVWGEPRDASNFHRWLHASNQGACREVAVQEVGHDVEVALNAGLAATSVAAAAIADRAARTTVLRTASRFIGISPMALGPVAGAIAPVVIAAAAAGGIIAYQRQVTRGKTPAWFTRTDRERVVLTEPYTPHPDWLRPGQRALG